MLIKNVVVNSSPLITLHKSQLEELLPQLFRQVSVPKAVWDEVTTAKNDIAAQKLPTADWVTQIIVDSIHPTIAAWDLGAGESEVLTHALLTHEHAAIIDIVSLTPFPVASACVNPNETPSKSSIASAKSPRPNPASSSMSTCSKKAGTSQTSTPSCPCEPPTLGS